MASGFVEFKPEDKSATLAAPSQAAHAAPRRGNDDVVQIQLQPAKAFEFFAGRVLPSAPMENVHEARPAASRFESPADRLHRLRREIDELASDFKELSSAPQQPIALLSQQLESQRKELEASLNALNADFSQTASISFIAMSLGADKTDVQRLSDVNSELDKQLAALDRLLSQISSPTPATSSAASVSFTSPSSSTSSASPLDIQRLEQRLAQVEKLVGNFNSPDDVGSLFQPVPHFFPCLPSLTFRRSLMSSHWLDL